MADISEHYKKVQISYVGEEGIDFGRGYIGGIEQFIKDIHLKIEQIISNLEKYLSKEELNSVTIELAKFTEFGEYRIESNGDQRFILKSLSLKDIVFYYDEVKRKENIKSKKKIAESLHKVLSKNDGDSYDLDYLVQAEYKSERQNVNNEEFIIQFLTCLFYTGKKNKTAPTKQEG